jgi:adhesin/invasin
VANVTVTAPTSSSASPITLAAESANPSVAVKTVSGTVTDSGSSGLAYKTVTLTGSAGVYFATDNQGTGLVNSIQVTSNGTGNFTSYAVFTKPGAATITATSEGKSVTVAEVVAAQVFGQAYNVSINNASGMPNSTTVVSGKVVDAFGNPVPGVTVTLTPDDVTLGVLGAPGVTNANGDYSATFTGGAAAGKVTVTATITAATLVTTWSSVGGLTLPASVATATGTIIIAPDAVALAGPKSRVGAGYVTLTGTARPGASVDVYKKTASGLSLVDSVTAGSDGKFSASVHVSVNTVFLAKSPTATSPAITVRVKSTIRVSTKVNRGGVLRVSVAGGPSKRGTITLWITHGKKTTKVVTRVTGGAKTWALKPGKGYTTVKATYAASGCDASSAVSTRVKL